jgi:hypothetical protein
MGLWADLHLIEDPADDRHLTAEMTYRMAGDSPLLGTFGVRWRVSPAFPIVQRRHIEWELCCGIALIDYA